MCVYRKLSNAFFVMWYSECDPMPNIFKSATNPPLLSCLVCIYLFFTLVHSHCFSFSFPQRSNWTLTRSTHKKKESEKRLNQVTQCKKNSFYAHPYWALLLMLLFMVPSSPQFLQLFMYLLLLFGMNNVIASGHLRVEMFSIFTFFLML